jgi:lysophospholipase L1-like esterase
MKTGDTLVWGITTLARVDYADGWKLNTNTAANMIGLYPDCLPTNIEYYYELTNLLICIRSILQVINFCKKIGVKLYLVNFLEVTWLPLMFNKSKNFLDLTKDYSFDGITHYPQPVDIGTDGLHPGPVTHKKYAEAIYQFLKEDNHGKTI